MVSPFRKLEKYRRIHGDWKTFSLIDWLVIFFWKKYLDVNISLKSSFADTLINNFKEQIKEYA